MSLRTIVPGVLAVLLAAPAVAADTYEVDPVHSSVHFRIRHLDVSWVFGRFAEPTGSIVFDPDDPDVCSVSMTVKAATVDTGNGKRDAHLRSADFFDVETHPEIVFRSTSWKLLPPGDSGATSPEPEADAPGSVYRVDGDLTLHGVTRSIVATAVVTGQGKNRDGTPLVGFLATFRLKRSDYGMATMIGPVGDEVVLTVAVEADRRDAPPDANRLTPEMAPSPFTADEIRRGCPAGRITVFRVRTLANEDGPLETPEVSREVFCFLGGDAEKAKIDILSQDAEGGETGKRSIAPTWRQLQGHASWPADRTKISTDTIETPAGKFVCWRYDVAAGEGKLARFWFAKDRAGPPVRMVRIVDGDVVFEMEMIRDDRP